MTLLSLLLQKRKDGEMTTSSVLLECGWLDDLLIEAPHLTLAMDLMSRGCVFRYSSDQGEPQGQVSLFLRPLSFQLLLKEGDAPAANIDLFSVRVCILLNNFS